MSGCGKGYLLCNAMLDMNWPATRVFGQRLRCRLCWSWYWFKLSKSALGAGKNLTWLDLVWPGLCLVTQLPSLYYSSSGCGYVRDRPTRESWNSRQVLTAQTACLVSNFKPRWFLTGFPRSCTPWNRILQETRLVVPHVIVFVSTRLRRRRK